MFKILHKYYGQFKMGMISFFVVYNICIGVFTWNLDRFGVIPVKDLYTAVFSIFSSVL